MAEGFSTVNVAGLIVITTAHADGDFLVFSHLQRVGGFQFHCTCHATFNQRRFGRHIDFHRLDQLRGELAEFHGAGAVGRYLLAAVEGRKYKALTHSAHLNRTRLAAGAGDGDAGHTAKGVGDGDIGQATDIGSGNRLHHRIGITFGIQAVLDGAGVAGHHHFFYFELGITVIGSGFCGRLRQQ